MFGVIFGVVLENGGKFIIFGGVGVVFDGVCDGMVDNFWVGKGVLCRVVKFFVFRKVSVVVCFYKIFWWSVDNVEVGVR